MNRATQGAAAPRIVQQIVGRCHVYQSNRSVIRYFISRLKNGYRMWSVLSRTERKRYMRWIIAAHAANRAQYVRVMSGAIYA